MSKELKFIFSFKMNCMIQIMIKFTYKSLISTLEVCVKLIEHKKIKDKLIDKLVIRIKSVLWEYSLLR